jgi:hypothetical protein
MLSTSGTTQLGWQRQVRQRRAARLSEATLAHKRDLNKTQQVQVAGLTVWVPVAPNEALTAEDEERSRVVV